MRLQYRRQIEIAVSIGDHTFACYLGSTAVAFRIFAGDHLDEVAEEAARRFAFAELCGFDQRHRRDRHKNIDQPGDQKRPDRGVPRGQQTGDEHPEHRREAEETGQPQRPPAFA